MSDDKDYVDSYEDVSVFVLDDERERLEHRGAVVGVRRRAQVDPARDPCHGTPPTCDDART